MNRGLLLACLVIAACASPAFAHAFLQRSEPGAGAALSAPPKRAVLIFSEQLEPVFSGMTVSDAAGRNVEAGAAMIAGTAMVAPLKQLPPGRYRVTWHAVSVDTHRTEGSYSFTVKP
jgi:hypothetical protein